MRLGSGEIHIDAAASSRASEVVALLGLAGEWVGTGRICCTPEFGCKVASRLLIKSYDALDEDVLDAIGEVANMIIGNVKNSLEERLGLLSLSTPKVIHGHNFEARSVGIRARITVDFESGSKKLQVQICISPATAKPVMPRSQVA